MYCVINARMFKVFKRKIKIYFVLLKLGMSKLFSKSFAPRLPFIASSWWWGSVFVLCDFDCILKILCISYTWGTLLPTFMVDAINIRISQEYGTGIYIENKKVCYLSCAIPPSLSLYYPFTSNKLDIKIYRDCCYC